MANYPRTKLIGVAYKSRRKMKNSSPCVHVLHKTLNVVISRCCFAEDDKEMYHSVKRTCRAFVFPCKPIVLWRGRCRRRRRCINSLKIINRQRFQCLSPDLLLSKIVVTSKTVTMFPTILILWSFPFNLRLNWHHN